MLRRLSASFLLLPLLLLAGGVALAQEGARIVQRGKAATALVVMPSSRGFGSAFCIDEAGFFVTNEHVVRGLRAGHATHLHDFMSHFEEFDYPVCRGT